MASKTLGCQGRISSHPGLRNRHVFGLSDFPDLGNLRVQAYVALATLPPRRDLRNEVLAGVADEQMMKLHVRHLPRVKLLSSKKVRHCGKGLFKRIDVCRAQLRHGQSDP